MVTRSMIGKLEADGTVTAIYCHWDGYPESVGLMLMKHYRDVAKIDAMMAADAHNVKQSSALLLGRASPSKDNFEANRRR